ncbi:hypothetical protein LY78DRAFT_713531 [Colletotrichum sublineola]|nr:hypothetical protein LY78DRAFT_713531 [Colletotrichum sublineola]
MPCDAMPCRAMLCANLGSCSVSHASDGWGEATFATCRPRGHSQLGLPLSPRACQHTSQRSQPSCLPSRLPSIVRRTLASLESSPALPCPAPLKIDHRLSPVHPEHYLPGMRPYVDSIAIKPAERQLRLPAAVASCCVSH